MLISKSGINNQPQQVLQSSITHDSPSDFRTPKRRRVEEPVESTKNTDEPPDEANVSVYDFNMVLINLESSFFLFSPFSMCY